MAANRPQAPPQTHGNMSSSSAPGPVAQKLPTPPHIPTNALQALIPRLTTTINEIDTFNAILAQGQIDGSLPSWDQILQRYATLLGRINSISSYLSLPPPAPPLRPGAPPPGPDASRPALERIIVHPLNPLPDAPVSGSAPGPGGIEGAKGTAVNGSNGPGAGANGDTPGTAPAAAQTELHPIAPEAFYQVINTQPLPSLISAQSESVARASVRGGWGFNNSNVDGGDDKSSGHITLDEPTLRRLLAGHDVPSIPESRGGNGPAIVQALRERLAERLKREEGAAKRLREVVQEKEEEYDWGMRIDEEGADDGAQGGEAKGEAAGDEDEDDLFGDDGEVQIIPPPAAVTASTGTAGAKAPAASAQGPGEGAGTIGAGAAAAPPNPRAGWSTADYIKYMDTGRIPPSAQS